MSAVSAPPPAAAQLVGQGPRGGHHPVAVLDDLAHVGEHAREARVQVGRQIARRVRAGQVAELDVHPRLGHRARRRRRGVGEREDVQQLAAHVAAHHDHRVHDAVHARTGPVDLGEHRVDEERHVVGDDEHRDAARGARGVEHRGHRLARHPQAGEAPVGPHGRQGVRRLGDELAVGHPGEVRDRELAELAVRRVLLGGDRPQHLPHAGPGARRSVPGGVMARGRRHGVLTHLARRWAEVLPVRRSRHDRGVTRATLTTSRAGDPGFEGGVTCARWSITGAPAGRRRRPARGRRSGRRPWRRRADRPDAGRSRPRGAPRARRCASPEAPRSGTGWRAWRRCPSRSGVRRQARPAGRRGRSTA